MPSPHIPGSVKFGRVQKDPPFVTSVINTFHIKVHSLPLESLKEKLDLLDFTNDGPLITLIELITLNDLQKRDLSKV